MARRKERATDRLNLALSRISATTSLVDTLGNGTDQSNAARDKIRGQLEEAVEEAYAALNDIRNVAASL